jgi:hypothetical protein
MAFTRQKEGGYTQNEQYDQGYGNQGMTHGLQLS